MRAVVGQDIGGLAVYRVCARARFCFVVPWRSFFGQLNSEDHYVMVCVCCNCYCMALLCSSVYELARSQCARGF